MARAAAVVLAAIVTGASGCSDLGPEPPGPTGTLTVSVTGLLSTAASGGWVSAQRTDVAGQPSQRSEIPPGGSVGITVPAGTYTVTYTPLGDYTATSTTRMTGVVVPVDGSTSVAFTVSPRPGTLYISVVVDLATYLNVTTYPETGGTASIQRADADEQTPITVGFGRFDIEGVTSVTAILQPGMYVVTYAPPDGYAIAPWAMNPQTARVFGGAVAEVRFVVTQTQ